MTRFLFALVVCMGLLPGCHPERCYQYCSVPTVGWNRADTLIYRLPDGFAGHRLTVEMDVRHTETYPYRDLWLALIHSPASKARHDIVHLQLADERGNWNGKGYSGCLYQYSQQVGTVVCHPSDSILRIVHLMKNDELPGLADVGVRLSLSGSVDSQKDE